MYCQTCGKMIGDNSKFCIYCGKPTANAAISNNVVSKGGRDKKGKLLSNAIKIGIAVIIILIIIVVILVVRGIINKETDTVESTGDRVTDLDEPITERETDMDEPPVRTSALNDIMGDWYHCLKTASGTYASWYEYPSYLRVEAEGITGISGGDIHTYHYAIGVDDITVQEENGITYYTYSAEMYSAQLNYSGGPSRQIIGIRLYLDEETGWLVCELNVPQDGFWQKIGAYEPMTMSIEERFESLRTGNYGN